MSKILITGGAGFIGLEMTRQLLSKGHEVTVLDNFHSQVHGNVTDLPDDLKSAVHLFRGNVQDSQLVRNALADCSHVVHLAAETGPAQSMYEIERYGESNLTGTSVLLQAILEKRGQIKKLVVASSRAVYGEGCYKCLNCGPVVPASRSKENLQLGLWDPVCPDCSGNIMLQPSTENAPPSPTSIYAVHKLHQELMFLTFGRAYSIPTFALRYQNVYGPGQSLTNPYIGVLAIFMARAKEGKEIQLFEDGKTIRDFVYISDVADATVRALFNESNSQTVLNVGSGQPVTLLDISEALNELFPDVKIKVSGQFRVGDIRSCYADLGLATRILGYTPKVDIRTGLKLLQAWAETKVNAGRSLEHANNELESYGLLGKGLLR